MFGYRNLSIRKKLAVGFGALLGVILLVGVFSLDQMATMNRATEDITQKRMFEVRYLSSVRANIDATRRTELMWLLVSSKDEVADYDTKLASALQKLQQVIKEGQDKFQSVATEEDLRLYQQFQEALGKCVGLHGEIVPLRQAGKNEEARRLAISQTPLMNAMLDAIEKVIAQSGEGADAAAQKAASEYRSARNVTLLLLALAIAVGIVLTILVANTIATPMRILVAGFRQGAEGDLTTRIHVSSKDEAGQVSGAFNSFMGRLQNAMQGVASSAAQVASASGELNSASQQITANSGETSAQADMVSKAAQQVNQNLQTVATGAEEMGASIREIAKNASDAARFATSAVTVAQNTTAAVSKLGDSSTEIGQVIKAITSIAQQTNLLALNATIEAARAGEAGKGFAVVANEVKELAKETAQATEDIGRRIEAIQTDTKAAVDAIASISGVIHQINEISGTIAAAMEEQNATTNEMSRNVSEASNSSGEITSNIAGVAQAAESTSRGAAETQNAAQLLVDMSAQLRRLVEQFRISADHSGQGPGGGESARRLAARAGA